MEVSLRSEFLTQEMTTCNFPWPITCGNLLCEKKNVVLNETGFSVIPLWRFEIKYFAFWIFLLSNSTHDIIFAFAKLIRGAGGDIIECFKMQQCGNF